VLDDAGHELRTPITIVRGHLELVDVDDPVDVSRTRDIAVDELDRMQRLVEELLILAKSRRPDFVRTAPVDVEALLYEVLDKVITLGDRRWRIDEAPEVTVMLDRQRITQALLQLVANAVRFTAPGGVIALGGRADTDTVALWVRDDGVGIRPEDQERIFERFARGAGQPEQSGAGLGLAIVGVIAEAHHGEVTLVSEPGQGATFRMIIPRVPAAGGQEQED
jgi:two-component system OmpR family sensor kinase